MGLLIDHLIRFSAFGILVIAAIAIFRYDPKSLRSKLMSAASVTGAAYLLCSSAAFRTALGDAVLIPLIFCLAGPWTFWTASISLFKDEFQLTIMHWAILALVGVTGLIAFYLPSMDIPFLWTHNILTLSLFAHAIWIAWLGRESDLIESRRQFRLVYVGGIATLGVAISSVELFMNTTPAPAFFETIGAAAILTLALLLTTLVLEIDPEKVFLPRPKDGLTKDNSQTSEGRQQQALLEKIKAAMEGRRLYREAGITIARLANEVNLPEYRLREAINQNLGFRNFNAFVNSYRIETIKEALRDPDQARTPILTLALEAGFNSIAPFNRAFLEATGMTPTAFRDMAHEPPAVNAPKKA